MRLLFIGDIVGRPGRDGLATAMPELRERYRPDLVVANGENSAGGIGITEKTARKIFDAGADVITSGNHIYRHRDVYAYLDETDRVIRPDNYRAGNPGRGHTIVEAAGKRVCVINLSGTVFLKAARSPFDASDSLLERLREDADIFVVDFHAEVTSEKIAMGWHLDGRVAAVFGTHTHVPTADGRILPGGTAFISDVGMTGSRAGVLGAGRETVLESFRTQMPVRFDVAEGDVWVMGACVEVGEGGLAASFEQVLFALER
ncbi:MAG: TIGR00282 family metallophosphoesterase [Solirubrobacterales bacterium]